MDRVPNHPTSRKRFDHLFVTSLGVIMLLGLGASMRGMNAPPRGHASVTQIFPAISAGELADYLENIARQSGRDPGNDAKVIEVCRRSAHRPAFEIIREMREMEDAAAGADVFIPPAR